MFNYKAIINRALKEPFFDTAPYPWSVKLQIEVKEAPVVQGDRYWKAICGYHLPNSGGNPNIYLSAVSESGVPIHPQTAGRMMTFGWDWEGRRQNEHANPVNGDKHPSEPSANINLGRNQIVTVWVEDVLPSDKVYNLRSDWPDAVFHSATFVCWQLSIKGTEDTPPPVIEPPDIPSYDKGFKAGRKAMAKEIVELINKL